MKKLTVILSAIIFFLTISLIITLIMYFNMVNNSKKNLENTLSSANEIFEANKKIQELEKKLNEYSKEKSTEIEYNNEEVSNDEKTKIIEYERQLPPDNLNINRKNQKEVLDRFLDLYLLSENGVPLLCLEYRGLNFYYNYDESQKNISVSNETVTFEDGIDYELVKTNITFEAYKNALLKFVSEEMFEKKFTEFCKNVEGILYILNSGGCGRSYTIENMDKISEEKNSVTYKVSTQYFEGENPPIPRELLTKFEIDDYGIYRVSYFEILN